MADFFNDLSRAAAQPVSRRRALRTIGAVVAGTAAATFMRPFRASAAPCPNGAAKCGKTCCPIGGTCVDSTTGCCCARGTTPCGKTCCKAGVACVNPTKGICGCPSGTTSCGSAANLKCCAAGKACGDASCQPVASFNTGTPCSGPCPSLVICQHPELRCACPQPPDPEEACTPATSCGPTESLCISGQTNGGSGPCGCLDVNSVSCPVPLCTTDADCETGFHCYLAAGSCDEHAPPGTTTKACIADCPTAPPT